MNNIIHKSLTILLLVVFALSITPKLLLHQVAADHKDIISTTVDANTENLTASGFSCDCHQLVVELPFAIDIFSFHFQKLKVFPAFPDLAYKSRLKSSSSSTDSRGPPSI